MAEIRLEGVAKEFGSVTAVTDVSLTIPDGQLVCFLGPSGCGKTTLLRLIAGLEAPTRGTILQDGNGITDRPAHRRNFGMVFQSLALFSHLTVAGNIAYGLAIRGEDRAARRRRVDELLELVRLPGLGGRHISQLSGGQRQRVAIARALAVEPAVFLLDEPLSALDAKLREAMQIELRQLQQRLQVTTVLVTHDQREAMTMADRIVVMAQQRVQQVGAPLEIYRRPANTFVADFIGASNLLPAVVTGTGVLVEGRPIQVAGSLAVGAKATLLIRPEDVHLLPAGAAGPNRIDGVVEFVRDVGASVETIVDCGRLRIDSIAPRKDRPPLGPGDKAVVELPAASCVLLAQ